MHSGPKAGIHRKEMKGKKRDRAGTTQKSQTSLSGFSRYQYISFLCLILSHVFAPVFLPEKFDFSGVQQLQQEKRGLYRV
jgi:hypothetical protein